jgi:rare lipoprotein A
MSFTKIIFVTLAVALLIGATATTALAPIDSRKKGVASWYGKQFHKKYMANGKRFDMHRFSVAHKSLPLGVVLHVTNLVNGKEIVVEVTDRGPFVEGRDFDFSWAAAKALGFTGEGLTLIIYREVG